jgi:hypothetical protein
MKLPLDSVLATFLDDGTTATELSEDGNLATSFGIKEFGVIGAWRDLISLVNSSLKVIPIAFLLVIAKHVLLFRRLSCT